jgi:hypothetical protein
VVKLVTGLLAPVPASVAARMYMKYSVDGSSDSAGIVNAVLWVFVWNILSGESSMLGEVKIRISYDCNEAQ